MTFHVSSMARPKRVAKSLSKALADAGHPLALTACQQAVARMYGHAGWHAMATSVRRGGKAPSLADCEAAPGTAAERRRCQEAVLAGLGVPAAAAAAALDAARPTGRGGNEATRGLPRLFVKAVMKGEGGTDRDLGIQDLTDPLSRDLCRMGLENLEADIRKRGLGLYAISASLSEEARRLAGKPGFMLDGFGRAWERFKAEIGDASDPEVARSLRTALDHANSARWSLKRAEGLLRKVEAARFTEDAGQFEMYAPLDGFDDDRFYYDPGEAYDGLLYDAYVSEVEPRPDAGFDSPEQAAFSSRYAAWASRMLPPVVFGTSPVAWGGLSARDVREAAEEFAADMDDRNTARLSRVISDMIECDLNDNHHEDAVDLVVDWKGLSFIDEWFPHAGSGDAVDLDLEAKIDAWNAEQKIVSYYVDHGSVVPVRAGVTKESALAWLREHVEECRRELERSMVWDRAREPAVSSGKHPA